MDLLVAIIVVVTGQFAQSQNWPLLHSTTATATLMPAGTEWDSSRGSYGFRS